MIRSIYMYYNTPVLKLNYKFDVRFCNILEYFNLEQPIKTVLLTDIYETALTTEDIKHLTPETFKTTYPELTI